MQTPTITKKQQAKTLSGKKNKKQTIKNVVANSFATYWPLLQPVDELTLKEILEKCLPKLRQTKLSVPYDKIEKIPREERKKFRQSFANQKPLAVEKSEVENFVFGVNNVTRLIENRQASSIFISGDVTPRLLVQHVIDEAVLFSVPVVIMPNLRTVLKEKCGFGSSTVAIRNTVEPDSNPGQISETIKKLSQNYPVPTNHINYHRRVQIVNKEVPDDLKSVSEMPAKYKSLKVKRLRNDQNRTARKMQILKERKK